MPGLILHNAEIKIYQEIRMTANTHTVNYSWPKPGMA